MFEYIKKYKLVIFSVLIGVLIAIFIIPVLINLCFKFTCPLLLFQAEWDASDALNYYGVVLSFLGTTMLSTLALLQNNMIREDNDKHTKQLENMEYQKNAPIIIVELKPGCKAMGLTDNVELKIKNISDNLAQNVVVSDVAITVNDKHIWKDDKKHEYCYVIKDAVVTLALDNPSLKEGQILSFKISYRDIFGNNYQHECTGNQKDLLTNGYFSIKRKQ